MTKNKIYTNYQRFVKNKDWSVKFFIENTLNKTQSMFYYKGLPPTMPQSELENILQRRGFAIIADVDGDLYALQGGLGGETNAYYKPTIATVANPYLKLSKTYTIENNKDAVLFKNDYLCSGLLPIVGKYAVLLTDAQISLNTAAVLSRLTMLISASDDKTKQSADLFIEKILNGDFSVIAENAFLKGVNLQTINANGVFDVNKLIELNQYYKANLMLEIGLNAQYNMKRERLSETEILVNNTEILPFVENMLTERKNAVEAINAKYGTQIEVDLKSAWKTEKENNDKSAETLETDTPSEETETATETDGNDTETETKPTETETETETNDTETATETDENETKKIVETIRKMREEDTDKNDKNE